MPSTWRRDPARKLVFMFAGQGSHYYQMGRELFDHHPGFRRHMEDLNALARAACGVDVLAEIYAGERRKHHWFDDIRLTHPAIYMVEYALAQTLIEQGIVPDGVLGVSMGNFAAATVAGSITPLQALEAIARQARAFHGARPGAMLALLGQARLPQEHALLREHSEIAAVNTPASFVLALPETSRSEVEAYLRANKINFQRMAVARAFHSRWIDDAAPQAPWLPAMGAPSLPWFCSTLGAAVELPGPDYLWQVVRQPIQLIPTVQGMEASGRFDYLDLSPSGTLAVVLKYLLAPQSHAGYTHVMSAFGSDLERLQAIAAVR